jgi:hypothetical protein
MEVSSFRSATDKVSRTTTVDKVIAAVRSDRFAQTVRRVRAAISDGHDKDTVSGIKMALPAVMFSGVFTSGRADAVCLAYTGVICADLDHIDLEDMDAVRDTIAGMPEVFGWFVSPSGSGYKVLVSTAARYASQHFSAWCAARDLFAAKGLSLDKQTKDIRRLCYASHDPRAVLRPVNALLPTPHVAPEPDACRLEVRNDSALDAAKAALALMPDAIEGSGGDMATRNAILVGRDYGITEELWWPVIQEWNQTHCRPPWKSRPLRAKMSSNYRGAKGAMGAAGMLVGLV